MALLDSITQNHSQRVWEIACGVERYYEHNNTLLSNAAYVHDIGKIYIPNIILDKPDLLTIDERDIIDHHAYLSYRVLMRMDIDEKIARICLYHHGTNKPGYRVIPMWEGDERIFEYASMLEAIDMYEAITADRPYRRHKSSKEAIQTMLDCKRKQNKKVIDYLKNPKHTDID